MTIYLKAEEVEKYLERYIGKLEEYGLNDEEIEKRLEYHTKNNIVIKYTKEWQNKVWDNLMDTWNQQGGYWVIQDYIHTPHVEFEHYTQKHKRSYEKGNVPLGMASKELTDKSFRFYKHFKKFDTLEGLDQDGKSITECEIEVEGTIISNP